MFSFLIFCITFTISLLLLEYYTMGDQVYYTRVYQELSGKNLLEGYLYYNSELSSKEFIHFLLSWLLSGIVEKNIFIAIANGLLAYCTSKLLIKWNVNLFIIFFIVVFNFYFIVLYTGAERLKFGVLFMAISFYYFEHKRRFVLFAMVAVMSHAQVAIIYLAMIFYFYVNQLFLIVRYLKIKKLALYFMIPLVILIVIMSDHFVSKFFHYLDIKPITELFQWFILFIISLFYTRNTSQTFFVFIVLAIFTLLLGGERLNMLTFFVFLYYGVQFNRGFNIGVIIILLYFFLKSILFVYRIFEYAEGFYENVLF